MAPFINLLLVTILLSQLHKNYKLATVTSDNKFKLDDLTTGWYYCLADVSVSDLPPYKQT